MVKVGDQAPDIVLPDENGNTVHLSNFRGQKVIVYFYPKDMTQGCTVEACDFRDLHPKLKADSVKLIGISPDPISRHAKFVEKYNLNFTLLADEDRVAAEDYGVWQEKKFMGRTFMGIVRSTFLIDEKGKVRSVWRKVSVKDHAAEVASKALGVTVKVPKSKAAAKKKTSKKKTTAKKKTSKKKTTKKAAAKKKTSKKKTTKKAAAKKKPAAKKKATKKAAAKKKTTKKAAAKKKTTKKKTSKKKTTKKAAAKKKPAAKKKATKKAAAKKKR